MITLALLVAAASGAPDPAAVLPHIALWSTGIVDVALREPPPPGTVSVLSMPEDFSTKTAPDLVVAQLRDGRFVHLEPFGDASPTKPVLACVTAENDAVHARVLLQRGTSGAIVDTLVSLSPQTKRLVFARAAVVASVPSVEEERAKLVKPSSKGDGVCKALDRAADGQVLVEGAPVVIAPRETRARGIKATNGPALFDATVKALPDLVTPSWALLDALADADDLRAFFAPTASTLGTDLELLVAGGFDGQLRHVVDGNRRMRDKPAPSRALLEARATAVDVTFMGDTTNTDHALAVSWLVRPSGSVVLLAAPQEPALIDDTSAGLVHFAKKGSKWTRVDPSVTVAAAGCPADLDAVRAWARGVYVGEESYRAQFDGYTTDLKELASAVKGDKELALAIERATATSFFARLRFRGHEVTVDETNAVVVVVDACKANATTPAITPATIKGAR